jgi:hypothetical protein
MVHQLMYIGVHAGRRVLGILVGLPSLKESQVGSIRKCAKHMHLLGKGEVDIEINI